MKKRPATDMLVGAVGCVLIGCCMVLFGLCSLLVAMVALPVAAFDRAREAWRRSP